MCEARRLTPEQIESMAVEIREFLLEYDMWIDTAILLNDPPKMVHRSTKHGRLDTYRQSESFYTYKRVCMAENT